MTKPLDKEELLRLLRRSKDMKFMSRDETVYFTQDVIDALKEVGIEAYPEKSDD